LAYYFGTWTMHKEDSGSRQQSRSTRPDVRNATPEPGDQLLAVNKMRFLGAQDAFKRSPLQPKHIGSVVLHTSSGRVADHVHEAVEGMQPAKQIIVLAVAPGKESREIVQADSFQAFHAFEALERMHLLWADAVDANLVQFAGVAPCRDRESEHIPER